jgi:hypothetical protein
MKTFCYEAYHVETSIQLFQEIKNSEALKTIPRYQSLLLITPLGFSSVTLLPVT